MQDQSKNSKSEQRIAMPCVPGTSSPESCHNGGFPDGYEIFSSIAFAFDSVYYIDLEKDRFFAPIQSELAARQYPNAGIYSELVGILAKTIIHPQDLDIYMAKLSLGNVRRVLEEKKSQEFEYRSRKADGAYYWMRNQIVRAGSGKDGAPLRAILFTTDIHEQKLRELHAKARLEEQNRRLALSEERFRIAMMNSSKVVCEYDFQANKLEIIAVGDEEENIVIPLEDIYDGKEGVGYRLAAGQQELKDAIKTVYNGEKTVTFEMMAVDRRGCEKWLSVTLTGVSDQLGTVFKAIGLLEDITALKEKEKVLQASENQYQQVMRKSSLAIYGINFDRGVFESCVVNSPDVTVVQPGDSYEEFILDAVDKLDEKNRHDFMNVFSLGSIRQAAARDKWGDSLEYEILLAHGAIRWRRAEMHLFQDTVTRELKGFIHLLDVHEQKCKELELQRKAEVDSLTGIYNKGATEKEITRRLKINRYIRSGVFFMIDLDNFKTINDTYGHRMGDAVIRECARVLKTLCRGEDVVGRLGGDEFCVFFEGVETREQVCERARNVCEKFTQRMGESFPDVYVSTTIGISRCLGKSKSFSQLYEEADNALYRQKLNGRNGYCFFDE